MELLTQKTMGRLIHKMGASCQAAIQNQQRTPGTLDTDARARRGDWK
jgi:hypothetical protein